MPRAPGWAAMRSYSFSTAQHSTGQRRAAQKGRAMQMGVYKGRGRAEIHNKKVAQEGLSKN